MMWWVGRHLCWKSDPRQVEIVAAWLQVRNRGHRAKQLLHIGRFCLDGLILICNRDKQSKRLLDRLGSPEEAGRNAVDLSRHTTELRPGTILGREWNGQMQQVAVLADGFAWNGKTYPSLSKAAFAITGTRWNGPKFFGLRDKPAKASSP